MPFFEHKLDVRVNDEILYMLEEILKKKPGLFESKGHIIRCAIIRFYNQEVLGHEFKPDKDRGIEVENGREEVVIFNDQPSEHSKSSSNSKR